MSRGHKRNNNKGYAERAYAYYKKYGVAGAISNGLKWLTDRPERLTALSTFAIFLATAVMVGVGIAQWRAINGQLGIMADDQRPWISIKEEEISSPLTFHPVGGASIKTKFTIQNTGHAPAAKVWIMTKMYFIGYGGGKFQMMFGMNSVEI